jgi:CBS domain-containing protein
MMKAKDLMTPDPFAVTPQETVARAAQLMRDLKVGCIPVLQDQHSRKLVGMITDRDIATRCVASGHSADCTVGSHMTGAPLHTVLAESDQKEIVDKMEHAQVRRIPVVSPENQLLGIVAQADIATKLGPIQPILVEEMVEAVSRPPLVTA